MLSRAQTTLFTFGLISAVGVMIAAGGCDGGGSAESTSTSTSTGSGGGSPTVTCANDPRAMSYVSNMAAMGSGKQLQVRIKEATPSPPARGNNTWNVEVLDAKGQPVSDATLKVTPYMPDHKHGTQAVPSITQQADGSFSVDPLYLFMPGLWTVTFDVTTPTSSDSAVFGFCIAG